MFSIRRIFSIHSGHIWQFFTHFDCINFLCFFSRSCVISKYGCFPLVFCDIMDHEPESFGWFKFHIRFAWIFANTYTLYLNMYDMYAGWSVFACINVYLCCIITMYTQKIIGKWKKRLLMPHCIWINSAMMLFGRRISFFSWRKKKVWMIGEMDGVSKEP